MGMREQLLAVGPLDGRYAEKVEPLVPITSEYGLIQRRVQVGTRWVSVLGSGVLPDMEPLGDVAQERLVSIADQFSVEDAVTIKTIEKTTNHDANAVVRWLKELLGSNQLLRDYAEMVHFGGTSEDTNNLAYALMLRDARDTVLLPHVTTLQDDLGKKAADYADIPLLARTHGQAASPTTLGKEMAVFAQRVTKHYAALADVAIFGKFNGASGNYSAATFAYPEVDWPAASQRVVSSFGFEFNAVTTQIEPHDWMARYFRELATGNTLLRDVSQDMWLYIMLGEFSQRAVSGEDGSSAMPNKVNPIDHENARGNFGAANALLNYMAESLPISRLQRDLEDSTTTRLIGEAIGHTLVGYNSLEKGLSKVYPNDKKLAQHLDEEWSVLMEPLQTVMRRYGVTGAYDIIKEASRDKVITQEGYQNLVNNLELPEEAKARLLALAPDKYTGRAGDIARGELS